jgi:hypothetical protein
MIIGEVDMTADMSCTWAAYSLEYKKQLGPAGDDAGPNPFKPRISSHIALRKLD